MWKKVFISGGLSLSAAAYFSYDQYKKKNKVITLNCLKFKHCVTPLRESKSV